MLWSKSICDFYYFIIPTGTSLPGKRQQVREVNRLIVQAHWICDIYQCPNRHNGTPHSNRSESSYIILPPKKVRQAIKPTPNTWCFGYYVDCSVGIWLIFGCYWKIDELLNVLFKLPLGVITKELDANLLSLLLFCYYCCCCCCYNYYYYIDYHRYRHRYQHQCRDQYQYHYYFIVVVVIYTCVYSLCTQIPLLMRCRSARRQYCKALLPK